MVPEIRRTARPRRCRLDSLLVRRGLVSSRDRAKRLILAGQVFVNGERATKAGHTYPEDAAIEIRGDDIPFVSRGGLKLAKALDAFGMKVAGRVALDIGASTGGFTDCLLQRGARLVYAVDVGQGQLALSLRRDPRVVVMERTNARYLTPGMFPEPIQFLCADVSFISLNLILPSARRVVEADALAVVLLKPQFEAGPEHVSKGGVVRDPQIHRHLLIERPHQWDGWKALDLTHSPITGPAGNIEYLIALQATDPLAREGRVPPDWPRRVERVVCQAHRELGSRSRSRES